MYFLTGWSTFISLLYAASHCDCRALKLSRHPTVREPDLFHRVHNKNPESPETGIRWCDCKQITLGSSLWSRWSSRQEMNVACSVQMPCSREPPPLTWYLQSFKIFANVDVNKGKVARPSSSADWSYSELIVRLKRIIRVEQMDFRLGAFR